MKAKTNYRADDVTVPPGQADTTVSPIGRVYVKYNDFETYPLFLVYYWRPDRLLKQVFLRSERAREIREAARGREKTRRTAAARQREEERREQKCRKKERRKQEEQLRQFNLDVYRLEQRNVEATRNNECLIL